MSLGDITVKDGTNVPAALQYRTTAGSTAINAGEPVSPATTGSDGITSSSVIAAITNSPIVSTLTGVIAYVGIAANTSTHILTKDGEVDVFPIVVGTTYLIAPKVTATWDTQAEYNALVGSRVTLDLTAGVYTINSTNAYVNGCVIMPLDIAKYPGKVAFQFRPGANYLNS